MYNATTKLCADDTTNFTIYDQYNLKEKCEVTQVYDYYLQKCVEKNDCSGSKYLSNGHCCPDENYWSENDQNC